MGEKVFFKDKGVAIVTVMVFMLILLIAGATFLRLATSERISTDKSVQLQKAFYIAEAGIERGKNWLNSAEPPPVSPEDPFSGPQSYGGGTYQITITPLSEIQYEISSVGGYSAVSKTLKVIMQAKSIFSYAAFGDVGLDMRANSYTDSYDSRNGLYGGANIGSNGDIGTNSIAAGAIDIRNNAWVRGDAIIGPGGDTSVVIDISDTAFIVGEELVADDEVDLPEVIAPVGLPFMGDLLLDSTDTAIISSSGEYSSILLNTNSILTLDGSITLYINGPFELRSNSQLVITADSDVNIYISGDFYQDANTAVNNVTKDPTKLTIYGTNTSDDIIWYSNSEFYGALYAPNADIIINSNAQIYGSIIGNSIQLDSNATIHYDEALIDETDITSGYRIILWSEEPAVWE